MLWLASERANCRPGAAPTTAAAPRGVHEGAFEQAELELGPQHPLDGTVEDLDGDDSAVDGVDQWRPVAVGHRELDVEPGRQRHGCGLGGIGDEVVVALELAHREVVGDDVAIEAPLVAEDGRQQFVRCTARDAVELVVGVHHRTQARRPDGRLERVEIHLEELTGGDVRRRPVEATLRGPVPHEVLRRGHDPIAERFALEAAYEGVAHRRDEVRVLAERLLDPAPPRVATHIEHRRQALVSTDRAHLGAHDARHPLDERWVPRAGEADRLGEDGGAPRHESGAHLFVNDGRYAESGLFDQEALDLVGRACCVGGRDVARTGHARHLSEAVLHQGRRPAGERRPGDELEHPRAAQLRHLLDRRHAGEQVGHPVGDRFDLRRGRAGWSRSARVRHGVLIPSPPRP